MLQAEQDALWQLRPARWRIPPALACAQDSVRAYKIFAELPGKKGCSAEGWLRRFSRSFNHLTKRPQAQGYLGPAAEKGTGIRLPARPPAMGQGIPGHHGRAGKSPQADIPQGILIREK